MSEDLPPIPADYAEDDESWIDDDYGRGGSPLSFWTYLIGILAWLAVIFGVWAFVVAIGAYAHDAMPTTTMPNGWRYPMSCCWSPQTAPAGRPGDCDQIPARSAKAISGGYSVTLVPGDHPMVKEQITVLVPYAQTKDSPDQEFHICFAQDMKVRCFFAPPPGV